MRFTRGRQNVKRLLFFLCLTASLTARIIRICFLTGNRFIPFPTPRLLGQVRSIVQGIGSHLCPEVFAVELIKTFLDKRIFLISLFVRQLQQRERPKYVAQIQSFGNVCVLGKYDIKLIGDNCGQERQEWLCPVRAVKTNVGTKLGSYGRTSQTIKVGQQSTQLECVLSRRFTQNVRLAANDVVDPVFFQRHEHVLLLEVQQFVSL